MESLCNFLHFLLMPRINTTVLNKMKRSIRAY